MDRFWDLFQESVILQGLLTVSLWGAIITLTLQGREVPGVLLNAGTTVLGFWFGTKVQSAVNKGRK